MIPPAPQTVADGADQFWILCVGRFLIGYGGMTTPFCALEVLATLFLRMVSYQYNIITTTVKRCLLADPGTPVILRVWCRVCVSAE